MLTYELKKAPGVPLYEALYRCIRSDILSGLLPAGEKLPSKRALAQHLEISKITVEAAYNQLAAEGYILSKEKVGYFVEALEPHGISTAVPPRQQPVSQLLDLRANIPAKFPFSVWSRLQRQVLLDLGEALLQPIEPQGLGQLRQAIAAHLSGFRGMQVDPDNIIIGAGTDFLYNLIPQLLGRQRIYALEEPGYGKIRRIYEAAGVTVCNAPMDDRGVVPDSLGNAGVLHFSPSHHFPSGHITPMQRRSAILKWALDTGSCIIEDDYDSEFRFNAHPVSSLYGAGRPVIYMNSFSKSLAPSIRIGYMVLPPQWMAAFREKLGFYSCTVSGFEQHALARFLQEGHFEKHINRIRKFYKLQRNRILNLLHTCRYAALVTIEEADAGLHFIVKVDTSLSDADLEAYCQQLGLQVHCLSRYYHGPVPQDDLHKLVVNYSGLREADLERLQEILSKNP